VAATVTELGTPLSGTTASLTMTITGSPQIGDAIVVLAFNGDATALSSGLVTDSGSNTYTLRGSSGWASPATHRGAIWTAVLTTALTSGVSTVKFNPVSTGVGKAFQAIWISGLAASPFDVSQVHTSQSTSTPDTGTTAVVAGGEEIAIACFEALGTPSFTLPTGYVQTGLTTSFTTPSSTDTCWMTYKDATLSGTQIATATLGASGSCAGQIAIFKVAAATNLPAGLDQIHTNYRTTVGRSAIP
jgi:hypothetical protein